MTFRPWIEKNYLKNPIETKFHFDKKFTLIFKLILLSIDLNARAYRQSHEK